MSNQQNSANTADKRIPLGMSGCLSGQAIRFNGGAAKQPALMKRIVADCDVQTFCPEIQAGMSVPREPVRLVQGADQQTVKMVSASGQDWTEAVQGSSRQIVTQIQQQKLRGLILKGKSPSCGVASAKVYAGNEKGQHVLEKSSGLLAREVQQSCLIPVVESEMLNSVVMADRFVRLVKLADDFYKLEQELSKQSLLQLYASYKMALMAASPSHYKAAGRLLADLRGKDLENVKDALYLVLYDGFNQLSHRGRHTNALLHLQGYFKRLLSKLEQKELTQLILAYGQGDHPLSLPMTMLRHYLMLHPHDYLLQQQYIYPSYDHLGLRNHL